MINYTRERYTLLLETIKSMNVDTNWEKVYRQLKGIKDFFSEYSWEELLSDESLNLGWINEWRQNKKFKEYYKLMNELDKLKPLL